MAVSLTSPTTPTTVIQGAPVYQRKRRPITSCPGQNSRAMVSLTSATGSWPWRSAAVKARPRLSGMPRAPR